MCQKVRLSKDEAKRTAERLKQWDDDPKAPLGVYRCADCGRWHVGHNKYSPDAQREASHV